MIKNIKKAGNFFIIPPQSGPTKLKISWVMPGEGDHRRWWRGYNFPGLFNKNVKKSREKFPVFYRVSEKEGVDCDKVARRGSLYGFIPYIVIFLIFD